MTLTEKSAARVARELAASLSAEDAALHRPRFNVAPADLHWLVRDGQGGRELVQARWGFGKRDGRPLVNARSESLVLGKRSPISRAFEARRCVVPADGFFEWTGPKSARRPLWFHRPAGGLLYLAGLYEEGPDGRPQFVVLTTEANALLARIHDRMPALLDRQQVDEWLARPAQDLLAPAPAALLIGEPVSQRVNDVHNDDPSCLAAAEAEPASPSKRQLELL